MEGLSHRGITVVSAPPLSHGFGFDAPVSASARYQRAHWIEANGSHHSTLVPTRLVQARDVTIAELSLKHPGRYTIVALTSSAPLSTSDGTLDVDVATVQAAGASLKYEHVSVR